MTTTKSTNQRVVLAKRPSGAPTLDNFRVEEAPLPLPSRGQMRLKTLYLSLDPYMRLRMNDGASYADPVGVDQAMCGGTVCRVEASQHPGFKDGDLVLAFTGWQKYALSDGIGVNLLDANMPHPSWVLGVLGMPGFTAYFGLLKIGDPKPGDTVVVGSATGAVGAVVGQIAKIKGCRAVGIAGGEKKCRYAVEQLGFDVCVDHRAPDFRQQLAAACQNGIDVYFENVGGSVLGAALPLLNVGARVPLCGLIAWYDGQGTSAGPDTATLLSTMLVRQIKLQGFVILDHYERYYAEFLTEISQWLTQGKINYTEQIAEGLEQAPQAFLNLLCGENFGKVVVRVAD